MKINIILYDDDTMIFKLPGKLYNNAFRLTLRQLSLWMRRVPDESTTPGIPRERVPSKVFSQ